MNFTLKIDYREYDLIDTFNNPEHNINAIKDSLDIGDIIFEHNNKIIILIERKKLLDLSSSLRDGRYKEQKERINKALHKNIRKIYLIEGSHEELFKTKMSENIFTGIKINTMLRDNIQVVNVNKFNDTILFIKDIYTRLEKYAIDIYNDIYNDNNSDTSNNSYSKVVCNIIKNKNITHDVYKIIQFQQIPKVSNNIAKLIINNIGSLKDILLKYKTPDEINNLKDIISSIKHGETQRKIGDKLANTIIEFIYN